MHEKLRVEIAAEELVVEVSRLLRKIKYGCKASRDLEKSSDSLVLNVAEGVAVFAAKQKAAKYDIARGEAREVQAALKLLVLKGKLTERDVARANELASNIIGMLTNLIKTQEARV